MKAAKRKPEVKVKVSNMATTISACRRWRADVTVTLISRRMSRGLNRISTSCEGNSTLNMTSCEDAQDFILKFCCKSGDVMAPKMLVCSDVNESSTEHSIDVVWDVVLTF